MVKNDEGHGGFPVAALPSLEGAVTYIPTFAVSSAW